jgi:hypothetical protein
MKPSPWWALLTLLLPLAVPAAEPADPCGGVRLIGGRVETGQPLVPGGKDTEACLRQVAGELRARQDIRSITVAARLPDEERLDGQGMARAKAAAAVLVSAGVPSTRVSAVAPPTDAGGPARFAIAYVERPARRPVARLRTGGAVTAGPDVAELRPRTSGDVLYAQDVVRTGTGWAELELADGSVVRVAPDSTLRLGVVALNAQGKRQVQLEVLGGTIEAEASKGGPGSVFELKTRTAVAGVRGTHFRTTSVDGETSRLETLEGRVALGAGQGETEVGGGYGSRVKGGAAPESPRPLLAAPEVDTPRAGTFQASPRLTWRSVTGARTYRVEVARGTDFSAELHRYTSDAPALALESLPAGKWFWRVQPLDADGFEGYSSKIYAFTVQP